MARWKVYERDNFPSCTDCGHGAPFARYRRGNGIYGVEITDYCPYCGKKMTGIDECIECPYSKNGEWQDNGICFACRGDTWLPGKKQNDRILREYVGALKWEH